jgi:hypothetical protein
MILHFLPIVGILDADSVRKEYRVRFILILQLIDDFFYIAFQFFFENLFQPV